jgi:hypothetical protein
MTEHRPPYYAISLTTKEESARSSATALASPLVRHDLGGAISQDIILLLPVLESAHSDKQQSVCLHLIHQADGRLGLCNGKTEQTCPCCGNAMCQEHTSNRSISLPDETGMWLEDSTTLLCETCAVFSTETIYAFHAFRLSIRQWFSLRPADMKTTHPHLYKEKDR